MLVLGTALLDLQNKSTRTANNLHLQQEAATHDPTNMDDMGDLGHFAQYEDDGAPVDRQDIRYAQAQVRDMFRQKQVMVEMWLFATRCLDRVHYVFSCSPVLASTSPPFAREGDSACRPSQDY